MNEKKGSFEINIQMATKKARNDPNGNKSGGGGGDGELSAKKGWILKVWEFSKEDSNKVIFALKVGLAVLLVSLLTLFRAPYDVFGTSIIWSILTVAIMFEYTVGATFNKGFNRALGSLLAGVLALAVLQFALCTGRVAEPIIIGVSIFLVGTVTSFMKLWPSLAPYEYGFRVILFTYCLIIVSGYRMGNPLTTAMNRLYSITMGGIVAVLVNVLVFPIWAGEQLHKELVESFESVADSLEECVRKYLEDDGSEHPEFSKTVMDDFPDEHAYKKCRATLNSSAKLDSLAPYNLRITFQSEIQDATHQAAELVRSLGKDISNMKQSLHTNLLKRVHSSTERLQRAVDLHSYLLTSNFDPPDNSSKPLLRLCHAPSSAIYDLSNKPAELNENNSFEQNLNLPYQNTALSVQGESYHELMRKQSRRLHSWPSREEGAASIDFLPRMKALESTAALSLATFTSLLIEFVARLDHLVEAVDDLSKMAKFKHDGI